MSFKKVEENVIAAAKKAATDTVAAAAKEAKDTRMDLPAHSAAGHPWYGVSPRVESAVDSTEAKADGQTVSASFGATKRRGDYGLMLERMNPYLRPAADKTFPTFAGRIREHLERD